MARTGVVLPSLNPAKGDGQRLKLILNGNSVGDDVLASMRNQLQYLQHFDVSGNCLGQKGATALAAAIRQSLRSLKSLVANNCYLCGQGFSEIVSSVYQDGPPVEDLQLSHNIERPDGPRPSREIAMLLSNAGIKRLSIGYNAFEMHSLIDISEAIMYNSTLKSLNFQGIDLSRVINNFALAFQRNTTLSTY
jgi:hypothetical protein